MSRRVRVAHRIVADVGIAVQILRVVKVRDDAVGLDEAVKRSVVVARVIVRTASDGIRRLPRFKPDRIGLMRMALLYHRSWVE